MDTCALCRWVSRTTRGSSSAIAVWTTGCAARTGRAFTLAAQMAAPELIPNDFAFRRYAFQLEHQQQTRVLGTTTITVAGGVAGHGAPPQRYFMVGFGRQLLAAEGVGFSTLARTQYAGNRALMLSVR